VGTPGADVGAGTRGRALSGLGSCAPCMHSGEAGVAQALIEISKEGVRFTEGFGGRGESKMPTT
jgi:hypothetical protein